MKIASTTDNIESKSFSPDRLSKKASSVARDRSVVSDVLIKQEAKTAIQFDKLLEEHINNTEKSLPFTIQQVEDAMFITQDTVISLQYIFYQKKGNYRQLEETYDMS